MNNTNLDHIQILDSENYERMKQEIVRLGRPKMPNKLYEAIGIPIEIDSTEKSVLNDENYTKTLFDTKKAPDYTEALIFET